MIAARVAAELGAAPGRASPYPDRTVASSEARSRPMSRRVVMQSISPRRPYYCWGGALLKHGTRGRLRIFALVSLAACGGGGPIGSWVDASGNSLPDGSKKSDGALVIHTQPGADHCSWGSALIMSLSWPQGTVRRGPRSADDVRFYVRDPKGVIDPKLKESFDENATRPADARSTGYHRGDWTLWVSETDVNNFVYLSSAKRTERWPRATSPPLCR